MDSSFLHDQALSFAPKRHAISFQSSAFDSSSEMIMMGDYYRMNNTAGMMFSGNFGMVNSGSSGYAPIGNSCASGVSDSVPGLKHDAGLAVEWSAEEQQKLEEGISMYAEEPNIMKYIKIAATLRDKTIRDVALRCRWLKSPKEVEFFTEYGESNRYKILEIIGKGSYGVVCSAVDTHTGEKVAIKKVTDIFEHASDAIRILQEIKLLRLLRHPDIVEIKRIMLPPSRRVFKDIYVVFELMESDLHQVRPTTT